MRQYLVPGVGIIIVLAMALILVLLVTLRPWVSADKGYETHLNFNNGVPATYTRTEIAWVDSGITIAPPGWVLAPLSPEVERGYALYVAYACSSCHRLDGDGGPVGPSVLGASERRIEQIVRMGPGGMPAYGDIEMSQSELDTVIAYIVSLGPAPAETPVTLAPTPTPWPAPTPVQTPAPMPTPTPTPAPTNTPTTTPEPGTVDTPPMAGTPSSPAATLTPTPTPTSIPTPTPEATPTPTPVPEPPQDLTAAKQIYTDLGCDFCHGQQAEGSRNGPALHGLSADDIRIAVREGIRNADSSYPVQMPAYPTSNLSNEELEQIISFLQSLD